MIKYKKGSLFDSECQTIVNTVNCVGVMGKGIALDYKKRYPIMFSKYKDFCNRKLIKPGILYIYTDKEDYKKILNFPTKNNWRDPSLINYLELGLDKFVKTYKEKEITSIAFPQLGCANGGLSWKEVQPLMESYLNNLDIVVEIWIYE